MPTTNTTNTSTIKTLKTLKDFDFQGKVVLLRTDYNVPIKDGQIISDLRIRASLPTLRYLLNHGARKIIIISHLGKPKGEVKPDLSLAPVAKRLQELLNSSTADAQTNAPSQPTTGTQPDVPLQPSPTLSIATPTLVKFCSANSGTTVQDAVSNLPDGSILLLENLRFDPGEEANSADFAAELAQATGAEVFVQDGFAVLHRAHASTSAITKYLPTVAGLLVEKEIDALSKVLHNPERPFFIIIGGAKVEDKQPLIDKFTDLADSIFVGGKIAADGYTSTQPKVHVARLFVTDADGARLDIAPQCVDDLLKFLASARTVLWNGVLGEVEVPEFAASSTRLAEYLGTHPEITSVICGGDTAGFVENLASSNPSLHYTLISTGGGATLEFLSGVDLPGITALASQNS